MNKLLVSAALAVILSSGCSKEAPVANLPPAAEPTTTVATETPAATAPTTATAVPSEAGVAPAATDDKAVDGAIDAALGDHAKYRAVIDAYQKAVADGDKEAVAALVDYPIEVTLDGKKTAIANAAGFVQNYDRIITPAIASVIKAQKYSELMVNSQGVMFGSGETWINGICKPGSADCSEFEAKVITIQAGGSS
jgi:hypothetical protein